MDNINTDNFLRQFLSSLLKKKVTKSQLISEFKDYYKENVIHSEMVSDFTIEDDDYDIDDENEDYIEDNDNGNCNGNESTLKNKQFQDSKKIDIISFLKKIQKSSEIYSHIRNKTFDDININRSLYDLERIQSFPANIFLLDLFSRELHVKEYYKALDLIKSFMIRRNICEYRTGELDSIFARLCRVSSTSLISNMKNDLIDDLPTNKEFINSFQKHQFKGKNKDRAKYVLEQIEYYLTENKNEYIINTNEDVHLEHIMPLKIISRKAVSKYGDWKEYLGADYKDKHKKYVWRIGNLTLLADELNLGASNNPYLKKKDFYKISSLSLNKSIVENFKHFKFANQEKRGLDLAEIAVKIWKF